MRKILTPSIKWWTWMRVTKPLKSRIRTPFMFVLILMCFSPCPAGGYDPIAFLLGGNIQTEVSKTVDLSTVLYDGCETILTITITPHTPKSVDPNLDMGNVFFVVKHPNLAAPDEFRVILTFLQNEVLKERAICFINCTDVNKAAISLRAYYDKTEAIINVKGEVREGRRDCEDENTKPSPDASSNSWLEWRTVAIVAISIGVIQAFLILFLCKQLRKMRKTAESDNQIINQPDGDNFPMIE